MRKEIEVYGGAESPLNEGRATLEYELDPDANVISVSTIIYDKFCAPIYTSRSNRDFSNVEAIQKREALSSCLQTLKAVHGCKIESINDCLLYLTFTLVCRSKSFPFSLQLNGDLQTLQVSSKGSFQLQFNRKYSIDNSQMKDELIRWKRDISKILDSLEQIDSTLNTIQSDDTFCRTVFIESCKLFFKFDLNSFTLDYFRPIDLPDWEKHVAHDIFKLDDLVNLLKVKYPSSVRKNLTCDICYEKLSFNRLFKCLNEGCKKVYHHECIIEWLGCNSTVKHYYNVKVFNCLNCNQMCTINVHLDL